MRINPIGAGLGLTISNTLVKLLNDDETDKIVVESEYEKGSTFSYKIKNFGNDNK